MMAKGEWKSSLEKTNEKTNENELKLIAKHENDNFTEKRFNLQEIQ